MRTEMRDFLQAVQEVLESEMPINNPTLVN